VTRKYFFNPSEKTTLIHPIFCYHTLDKSGAKHNLGSLAIFVSQILAFQIEQPSLIASPHIT
jgi:hypothetical protein